MSEHTIRLQSNQNSKTTLLGASAPRKLGQLIDVNMTGIVDGDLVSYDANTQTYVPTSGIPSYSLSSGVSTSVIGGIGSITQLYVSGISTLGIVKISSGIVTATSGIVTYYGDGSYLTNINASSIQGTIQYAEVSGISTVTQGLTGTPNIVVGIATASSFVGDLTGTATTATNLSDAANIITGTISSSRLSGTYDIDISGNSTYANTAGISTVAQGLTGTPDISVTNINASGISTLGTVQVSSGIVTATSGIITYYGDGSKLTGVNAFNVVTQSAISSPVYPTFATATGVSSVGISTQQFVFIPSSGNLGIGTTNPTSKLTVVGDVNVSGVITATSFVGDGSGLTNVSGSSGVNGFVLSYMF